MNAEDWDARIDEFYEADFDEQDPTGSIEKMQGLVALLPDGDPNGIFELAGVHDSLGLGDVAIPLYQEAMAIGLAGERKTRVVIQLASTLRSVGRARAAVDLLESLPEDAEDYDAAQAFLALALFDAGEKERALHVALTALIPTLSGYKRALNDYVEELRVTSLDSLLAGHRPKISRQVIAALRALLTTPSSLALGARSALIRRVALQHGSQALAAQYAESDLDALEHPVLDYVDTVSLRPSHTARAQLEALIAAGYSANDVVVLNQIAAVGAVAARMVEGTRAIAGQTTHASTAVAAEPILPRQATWTPWLTPLLDADIPESLHATYGRRLKLPFLRILAPAPDLLAARIGLDHAALLDRGGVDRGERELVAAVMSRVAQCDTCAMVHAEKAAQFLAEPGLAAALLTAQDLGGSGGKRAALIQFAGELALTPAVPSGATLERLREHGYTDADLHQLAAAVAYMAWPNRVTLGLGEIS